MASSQLSFTLSADFVRPYHDKPSPFGYAPLGDLVYSRTYSRAKEDGSLEKWPETVQRVVNGTYSMQKDWVLARGLGWIEEKGKRSAEEMYDRIFNLKFTPPGRGLWVQGTDAIFKKGLAAALNNCAFVSTEWVDTEGASKPFRFLMDMSMLGVGVGFDTKGAGKVVVKGPVAVSQDKHACCECDHTIDPFPSLPKEWKELKQPSLDKKDKEQDRYFRFLELYEVTKPKCIRARYMRYLAYLILKCEVSIASRVEELQVKGDISKTIATDWTCCSLAKDIQMYKSELCYVRSLSAQAVKTVVIDDDREGWVAATGDLIDSYFNNTVPVIFDYTGLREKGEPLKTFGGLSSGPEPLLDMHIMMRRVLDRNTGSSLSITTIVDLQNLIGKAVVAGNVRRSSEIALGESDSEEFVNLKNYSVNPERTGWGWCSNNSITASIGMNYTNVAQRIKDNGEPGLIWMDNARNYSRMGKKPDYKDLRASGTNPCSEQTLCHMELCTLVEVFPTRCDSLKDFLRTLKFAYLYAKTATLGTSHWVETNRVMMRNRRIGCSLSGITDFLGEHSVTEFKEWCTLGYDEIQRWDRIYSEYLAIPLSIKTTSIKPSGTVSLLAGVSPGVHFPTSKTYIRRMRLMKDSHLVAPLIEAGYVVEPCIGTEKSTVVVEIPIRLSERTRTASEVGVWEKMELAAMVQEHWADNQVSVTVDFDKKTEGDQLAHILDYFQYRLKSVSFLPRSDTYPFPQMPYEDITSEQYEKMRANIRPVVFDVGKKNKAEEVEVDNYCDGEKCVLPPRK